MHFFYGALGILTFFSEKNEIERNEKKSRHPKVFLVSIKKGLSSIGYIGAEKRV